MLLRQKPMCSKLYIAVKDAEINDYLQMVGFIPKYYDNYIYYYKRSYLLEHLINACNELKNRKEVSGFGNL
jgi:hypothetical protein